MEETPPYAFAVSRSPYRIVYPILLLIRNPGRFPRVSVSSEMPISSNPFSLCLLYTSTKPGISSRQGGHQVAKKLMTAGFPVSRAEEKRFPFVSLRENAGAVLEPEDNAVVPVSAFVTSCPCCQFRYSRRNPTSTATNIRIRGTAPIALREGDTRFIRFPPDGCILPVRCLQRRFRCPFLQPSDNNKYFNAMCKKPEP